MRILVIGFTHLAMVYSACFASKGNAISICHSEIQDDYDYDYKNLMAEPFLHDYILDAQEQGNFFFVRLDTTEIGDYDLILIAEDTPLDNLGFPIHQKISNIINYVNKRNTKKIPLILMSQVYPGFCANVSSDYQLIYWVETLVFGRAIERAINPEQIVLGFGGTNRGMPNALRYLLKQFTAPIHRMSWESAELTKISFNFMLSMSVLGANFLASVAEFTGADWKEVKGALKFDSRIGEHAYLNPGLGITGGNLPRDLNTLRTITARMTRHNSVFLNEIIKFNECQYLWLSDCVEDLRSEFNLDKHSDRIGLLGLSYKEGTASTVNSPSIKLASYCLDSQYLAFDPIVKEVSGLSNLEICNSLDDLIQRSTILILATPWKEIVEGLSSSTQNTQSKFIIDAGSWLESDVLERFKTFRQRGRGINIE